MGTVARKRTTVSLPEYMLTDLRTVAERKGVSVSRIIEDIAEEGLYRPNAETLAAIEESRSGRYAGVVDTSSFEAFMKSFDE